MGDFRIVIEAVGGHGCARESKDGTGMARIVGRCHRDDCPDCQAERFVQQLKTRGANVVAAYLEHWPVPGAAGITRNENAGPIDDLLTGVRHGEFGRTPHHELSPPTSGAPWQATRANTGAVEAR